MEDFINVVVSHVNSNYRTLATPASTTILGADLGGLLSIYAAKTHPDVFGNCVAMSPLLWLNRNEMLSLATENGDGVKYLLTYGSNEPDIIKTDVINMASALGCTPTCLEGGLHNDESWGEAFPSIYPFLTGNIRATAKVIPLPAISAKARAMSLKAATLADYTTAKYAFYYAENSTNIKLDNSVSFNLINDYTQTNLEKVQAQVLLKKIPASVKSKVYWNVARKDDDGSETFLKDAVQNVGFSSKKTKESWLRVVIRSGESVSSTAASSGGFKIYAGDNKISMTPTTDYKVSATVSFPGDDKTFTVHFGSVNSESDMGAITGVHSVSDKCTEATVEYDFPSNSIKITETKWGEVIGKVSIAGFSAVPSFTEEGESSDITIELDEPTPFTANLNYNFNYGSSSALSLTQVGQNKWTAGLNNLQAGIYTLSLDLQQGKANKENVAEICIKVVKKSSDMCENHLTVNAYENVDWATTGQYKANFHTHTSQSFDTNFTTTQVVDKYAKAGYKILALTDHDANSYPWTFFDLFNPSAQSRNPEELGMLAIPGVELSKDNTNSWQESTGGDFNHHNDFFTGRKGQEFATLRESYAYTNALGGMQIINHPGQYWSLDKEYKAGEKNSPEWHAENFQMYPSLIGLEVYNQGNRRPNDRILWDQILDKTMPERPVWGYSCDDTHTAEQYFRNYQFMLMPALTEDHLKEAMRGGCEYFCYEFTGSGEAKAPRINSINVDKDNHHIIIDTDAPEVYWISSTDKPSSAAPGKRKSTIVGIGKDFDYNGFKGSYVRALLKNDNGETCTQPFGFSKQTSTLNERVYAEKADELIVFPNPAREIVTILSNEEILSAEIYSMSGIPMMKSENGSNCMEMNIASLPSDIYLVKVKTPSTSKVTRLIVK